MIRALAALVALSACSGNADRASTAPVVDLDLGTRHVAPADAAPRHATPASPSDATPEPPPTGQSFATEADLLFRVAACGGDPARRLDGLAAHPKLATIVARHCERLDEQKAKFRAAYLDRHRAWFARVVPADVPRTVVYPFGGGDLLSSLVAFPEATETTTISLELAGDPRRIATLAPDALRASLAAIRVEIGGLLQVGSNTSKNLSSQQRNDLPAQVVSFLLALATAGFEPVDLRYFTLDDRGAIRYLDAAAIAQIDGKRGQARKGDWHSPAFSEAFAHVELRYRRPGESAVRVHRHLGWNLADHALAEQPQLVRHLDTKGPVTILVKGASYLLHRSDFATFRGYLLAHGAWMLSDSTGIPPTLAPGMIQETYGSYSGAFLESARGTRHDAAFVALWRRQPRRALGFRFGYVDAAGAAHLVVTRPR